MTDLDKIITVTYSILPSKPSTKISMADLYQKHDFIMVKMMTYLFLVLGLMIMIGQVNSLSSLQIRQVEQVKTTSLSFLQFEQRRAYSRFLSQRSQSKIVDQSQKAPQQNITVQWGPNMAAPFRNREGATCAQTKTAFYMYGGLTSDFADMNDVWYGNIDTAGNVTFKQLVPDGSGPDLLVDATMVANSKGLLLLLGGFSYKYYTYSPVVYASADGSKWSIATASAPWGGRYYAVAAVTADDTIVLASGTGYNGIYPISANQSWFSQDAGVTWTKGGILPFTAESVYGSAMVFTSLGGSAGTLLMVGGLPSDGSSTTAVYASTDKGITWNFIVNGPFSFKIYHTMVSDVVGNVYLIDEIDIYDSLWFSADAGRSWSALSQPGSSQGCAAYFASANAIVMYSGFSYTNGSYIGYYVGGIGK